MRLRSQDRRWTTEFVLPASLASTNPLPPLLPAFLVPMVTTPTTPPHLSAPHVRRDSMRIPLPKPTVTLALLVHSTVKLPRPLPLPANHVPQVCIKMHLEVPNANCARQEKNWSPPQLPNITMNCRTVKIAGFFNLTHLKGMQKSVIYV